MKASNTNYLFELFFFETSYKIGTTDFSSTFSRPPEEEPPSEHSTACQKQKKFTRVDISQNVKKLITQLNTEHRIRSERPGERTKGSEKKNSAVREAVEIAEMQQDSKAAERGRAKTQSAPGHRNKTDRERGEFQLADEQIKGKEGESEEEEDDKDGIH